MGWATLAVALLVGCAATSTRLPSVRFLAPEADVELSPDQVLGTLHASRDSLAACFAGAAPAPQGVEIRLDFVIDESGAVVAAQPPHAGLGADVDACLTHALLSVRFAPPNDEEPVRVREVLCVGCTAPRPARAGGVPRARD